LRWARVGGPERKSRGVEDLSSEPIEEGVGEHRHDARGTGGRHEAPIAAKDERPDEAQDNESARLEACEHTVWTGYSATSRS
jgi:hypothetical protein